MLHPTIVECPRCNCCYYKDSYLLGCPRCTGQISNSWETFKVESVPPTNQNVIREVGTAVVDLLIKKNKDYGSSVFESPVLFPQLKAKDCILIRMSDKIKRFSNLVGQEDKAEVDETIADTMQDLAGYAILWLVAKELEKESSNAVHRD